MLQLMKNASRFLQYPILQYIPITLRTLGQSSNWSNPYTQPGTRFLLFQDPQALQSALSRFQVAAQTPARENELYVIALNFQARGGLFRYLTCKIIGSSHPDSYHVFAMTKKYFPRRVIHFAFYEENGEKIRWQNQEIF
jgi:hypothetical protein